MYRYSVQICTKFTFTYFKSYNYTWTILSYGENHLYYIYIYHFISLRKAQKPLHKTLAVARVLLSREKQIPIWLKKTKQNVVKPLKRTWYVGVFYNISGVCKNPEPFQMVFPDVFFFPLIVFPSAGFTPWAKNSHERGKGKGKGKGKEKENNRERKGKRKEKERRNQTKKERKKERKKDRKKDRKKERRRERKSKGRHRKKERERKREKRPCLTRTIFDAKSYRFRYRFVVVRESCMCSFFSGNHQKRSVATTCQAARAPSLCKICAIMTANTETKNQKH